MGGDRRSTPTPTSTPTDEVVVQTAAEAAENIVFTRIDREDVTDFDVTVTFEDGVLELDVYLNADTAREDPEQVAEDAVLAGRAAVDQLLE